MASGPGTSAPFMTLRDVTADTLAIDEMDSVRGGVMNYLMMREFWRWFSEPAYDPRIFPLSGGVRS